MAVIVYVFDAQLTVQKVLESEVKRLIHLEHTHELQAEVLCPQIGEGWCLGFSCVDGRFRLFEVDSCETDDETGYSAILATDRAVRELGDIVITDRRAVAMTPVMAVEHLLDGTGWQVAQNTAGNGLFSYRAFYTTLSTALLVDVPSVFGCLIEPYYLFEKKHISARCIDVLSSEPVWRGRLIESGDGSNSVTVKMTGLLKTALYGRGKGVEIENDKEDSTTYGWRLSFADVEWSAANGDPVDKPLGQEWVGDPEALALLGRDGRHRFGVVVFSDEEDKDALLRRTWEELQRQKSASISVNAGIADLETTPGNEHRAIRMNDLVAVRPVSLPGDYILPITKIKRDYVEPEATSISAGSTGQTSSSRLADLSHRVESMEGKSSVWDRANAFGLDGALDVMKSQIISTQGGWYTDPVTGSIMLESADGTRAMMLNGSGFLIADSKTGEEWNWRTAATGGGIVADSITAGVLNAALVRILGNANFYWDAGNIYIINPDDLSQQIRIGLYDGARYGIGFTRDGGSTWQTALDFNGLNVQASGFAKVYVQLNQPPSGGLNVGDMWVQQRQPTTWDTLSSITWNDAAQYAWNDFEIVDPKTYVWDGSVWVLSMDVPLLESYGTQIQSNAKAIQLKADSKTVEYLTVRVDESEKTVEELTGDVQANAAGITALATRTAENKAAVEVVAGKVETKAESTVVTTLTGRVNDVEGETADLDERLSGVEYSTVELGKTVEKNSAALVTQAYEISARVKYSEYNSLTGRVDAAESELTAQAQEISAKISYNEVIQAILLSTEGLKIDVSKLDINGFVSLNGDTTISTDGTLTTKNMIATNAAISGTFSAPYAYIGEQLYKNDGYSGLFFSGGPTFNPNNIKAAVARDSYGDYHFSTTDGSLYLDTNLSGLVLINGSQVFLTAYASDETLVIGRDGLQENYQDVCFYPDSSRSDAPRGNCGTPAHPWDTCTADQFFSDNAIKSRSSRELKKDIRPLDDMGEIIDSLAPVEFRYTYDAKQRLHYGLIFEDTENVAPVLCSRDGNAPEDCRIAYEPINIILLKEVQALRKRLFDLEGVVNVG